MSDAAEVNEPDRMALALAALSEPDRQVALALAALSVAFVRVLQDLPNDPEEPLVLLQRHMQCAQNRLLRETPGAERAVAMFRFVIHALRNPNVIKQPED